MKLFKKSNDDSVELKFHCSKCDTDLIKESSECRKVIYPGFANSVMTYYFTHCPNCGKQISARYN
ncbi:hypothetical protein [Ruminococcus sp. YE282]|uniref:hypothetical protein n=1 Tax=Ruminococcus sp. YE282 TaxID=3158780 RepID=UPI00088E1662|nr:hypothetical protein SAMN02910441_01194 [Ruminococcus bromii]